MKFLLTCLLFLLSSMVAVASVSFDVGLEKTKHQTEIKKTDLATPVILELAPEVRWCTVSGSNFEFSYLTPSKFTFKAPKQPDLRYHKLRYSKRLDKAIKANSKPKTSNYRIRPSWNKSRCRGYAWNCCGLCVVNYSTTWAIQLSTYPISYTRKALPKKWGFFIQKKFRSLAIREYGKHRLT